MHTHDAVYGLRAWYYTQRGVSKIDGCVVVRDSKVSKVCEFRMLGFFRFRVLRILLRRRFLDYRILGIGPVFVATPAVGA